MTRLNALLDWFLSASIRADSAERERGRVLVALLLLGSITALLVVALTRMRTGAPPGMLALIGGSILVQAALLFALSRMRSSAAAGDLMVVTMTVPLIVTTFIDGGLHTGAAPWYPVAPLVAGVVGTRLRLVPIGGLMLAVAISAHMLELRGLLPPAPALESTRALRFVTVAGAVVYATTFVFLLDRSRRRAQAAREEVLAAREEWVSIVAHELRSPATSLGGAVTLLDRVGGALDAEERDRLLATARKGSDRLTRLLADLNQVKRLDQGRTELKLQPTDVGALAEDCAAELELALGQCTLVTEAATVVCTVDADRIRQIITNLVRNAETFSPPGSAIRLRVRALPQRVRIEVEDEGPGLPVDAGESIFDRFRQADRARAPQGLGLGLFISRQFVELHGGRIGHEPGANGARFWVELPRGGPTG